MTTSLIPLITTGCLIFAACGSPISSGIDVGAFNLVYLGTVDGKGYFSDMITIRNWLEALQFCNESGMRLATITTQREADFLANVNDWTKFDGHFWTAGRDSQTASRFVWDHGDEKLNESVVTISEDYPPPIQMCLAYSVRDEQPFHAHDCSLRGSDSFTLCETTDSKNLQIVTNLQD